MDQLTRISAVPDDGIKDTVLTRLLGWFPELTFVFLIGLALIGIGIGYVIIEFGKTALNLE